MTSRQEENGAERVANLEQLLQRIEAAGTDQERVTLDAIMDEVGRRSFGPVLLLAGVITAMPIIGAIPGVPSLLGIAVLVTTGQLLIGRKHFWMPRFLLERSLPRDKLSRGVKAMRGTARGVDRLLGPRLKFLTDGPAVYVIAITCSAMALATPFMELVPFSGTVAGAAMALFGLALVAHDGLLALIAFTFSIGTAGWLFSALIG